MARGPKKPVAAKANRSKSAFSAGSQQRLPSSSASVAGFNDESDIPMDDQDLFHKQRDEILLGGNDEVDDQADEDDPFGGEREIMGLDDEMSQDSEEEQEEEEEEEGEDSLPTKKQPKSKASQPKPSIYESASEPDDDDEEDEEDDLDKGWGSNKRSYFGTNNMDNLDSDDSELDEEEAKELELNEVKSLQTKSRKSMTDEDFGLGEDGIVLEDYRDEAEGKRLGEREKRRLELDEGLEKPVTSDEIAATSVAATTLPSDPAARSALLAQVQKTSPETVALAGEFADVVEELERVEVAVKKVTEEMPNHPSLGLMHLHHQTLVTYVTTITYYFYLRSLPQYSKDPVKLTKHAVLGRLVKLKTALSAMGDLGLSADAEESDDEGLSDEEDEDIALDVDPATIVLPDSDVDSEDLGSLEEDELDGLMDDEKENQAKAQEAAAAAPLESSAVKKGKGKFNSTPVQPIAQDEGKSKKKKGSLKRKAEVPEPAPLSGLADLEEDEEEIGPSISSKKKRTKNTQSSFESAQAFGEPTTLSKADQAEKSAKRRSLQFYTGQISSKDARKEAAAKSKLTGDADIPYRDRDRSRETVSATLANKAAKANGINISNRNLGDDGDDWDEEDKRDWRDVMGVENDFGEGEAGGGGDDGGDDYYDLVASGKRKAKKQKKEEYEEAREAERYVPDDSIEEGGHRSINRQIEKNRGLTPHRPKTVRNPRVKKRMKFDKASKKLGSIKPIYKGGQSSLQGGYEGEKSGISSHLVKSRSFGK